LKADAEYIEDFLKSATLKGVKCTTPVPTKGWLRQPIPQGSPLGHLARVVVTREMFDEKHKDGEVSAHFQTSDI
jgi:hypothetical protein